jgi:transcriptional regulator with XRE-family HTH domain
MEKLRAYIEEVIKKEGLNNAEIQRRSEGEITDSYLIDIRKGKTKHISVEKLNALAKGLGVSNIELFRIASGEDIPYRNEDAWPSHLLSKTIDAIVHSPELTRAVKAIIAMKPAKLKALLKQLEKE